MLGWKIKVIQVTHALGGSIVGLVEAVWLLLHFHSLTELSGTQVSEREGEEEGEREGGVGREQQVC